MTNNDIEHIVHSYCDDENFFKSITEISASKETPPESVIYSDFKILFFDKLSDEVNRINFDNELSYKHKSVDGLYFIKEGGIFKLYFIEFKHVNSKPGRSRKNLAKIKIELKLKALESLFCVLPHIIENYYGENFVNSIQSQLLDIPKYYISVLKDRGNINKSNEHVIKSSDFLDMERLSKYPFTKSKVVSPKEFESFMKKKFYNNLI